MRHVLIGVSECVQYSIQLCIHMYDTNLVNHEHDMSHEHVVAARGTWTIVDAAPSISLVSSVWCSGVACRYCSRPSLVVTLVSCVRTSIIVRMVTGLSVSPDA